MSKIDVIGTFPVNTSVCRTSAGNSAHFRDNVEAAHLFRTVHSLLQRIGVNRQ